VIAGLTGLTAAFAGDPDNPEWNGPEYQPCGQSCIHDRAVETLSMSDLYTVEKSIAVKNMDSVTQETQLKTLLGPFCQLNEDIGDCKTRYLNVSSMYLNQVSGSIAQNNAAAGWLKQRGGISISDPTAEGKKGNVTTVPTIQDLDASYQKHRPEMREQGAAETHTRTIAYLAPRESDYAQYKEVLENPNDPNSKKVSVPTCNKPPCLDGKAKAEYKKALLEYQKRAKTQTDEVRKYADKKEKLPLPKKIDEVNVDPDSVAIYNAARKLMIDEAQKSLNKTTKTSSAEINFGDKSRGPAGSKPTPATGKEKVDQSHDKENGESVYRSREVVKQDAEELLKP